MTTLYRFSPPSLATTAEPPVFLLRECGRRERRNFTALLLDEGLRNHSTDALRAEARAGLRELWDGADVAANLARVEGYWAAADAYTAAIAAGDADATFALGDGERAEVEALLARLSDAWPPLARMGRDLAMYTDQAPSCALAAVLAGWEGIPLLYRRDAGLMTLDLLEQVQRHLAREEQQSAGAEDASVPGTAYAQLCVAAMGRLFPSEIVMPEATEPADAPTPEAALAIEGAA